MAYGDFKDLSKRTAAAKVLRDKAFNIAGDPKYDGCQRGLASMVYKNSNKKTADSSIKSMPQNEQLAEQLHKPIIRIQRQYLGTNLADMQLINKFKKGFRFLLCVIDIFSKYTWVVPLKDKKDVSTVSAFQEILDDSKRKPNKIWVDKGSEFYNNYFKK